MSVQASKRVKSAAGTAVQLTEAGVAVQGTGGDQVQTVA